MQFLKQSTAVTLKIGPFLDDSDGKTAETGLTISQADVRLSKNGGDIAQKNEATSCTHDELGIYGCPLNTTDTDTLGRLQLWVHESGALPVFHEYMVLEANAYDALMNASAGTIRANVVQISDDANAAGNLEADYDGTGYNKSNSTIGTCTANGDVRGTDNAALAANYTAARAGYLDKLNVTGALAHSDAANTYKADVSNLDAAVSTRSSHSAQDVWDKLTSALTAAGSIGKKLADWVLGSDDKVLISTDTQDLAASFKVDAKRISNSPAAADNVESRIVHLDTAVSSRSSHSAADVADAVWNETRSEHTTSGSFGEALDGKVSDVKGQVDKIDNAATTAPGSATTGSLLDRLANKDANKTYDQSTDSLEAIRDRGDTAWTTGGGGSINDILNIQPLIPNALDLADTVTVRIGLGLTNMVDDLPATGEITPGTISIDRKAIGGTSWTNVVSDAACSEVAGLVYYDEVFDSGSGYTAGDTIKITFKNQKITVDANDFEITGSDGWVFQTYIREAMRGTDNAATDTVVDAIKTQTDKLQFAGGNDVKATLDGEEVTTDTASRNASKADVSNLDVTVSSRSSHSAGDIWNVGNRALTDKAGFSLSTAGIKAIWDELTSALTTAGSIGKKLADWVLGSDDKVLISTDTQDLVASFKVDAKRISNSPAAADNVESRIVHLDAAVSSRSSHSAADVADAVWNETRSEHTTGGSFGEALDAKVSDVKAKTDNVDDIKAVTDKLDSAMEVDGAVYRFTTNALEEAPTGEGTAIVQKAAKMIVNKAVQNKITGAIEYYDSDGETIITTHTPSEDESTITRTPS